MISVDDLLRFPGLDIDAGQGRKQFCKCREEDAAATPEIETCSLLCRVLLHITARIPKSQPEKLARQDVRVIILLGHAHTPGGVFFQDVVWNLDELWIAPEQHLSVSVLRRRKGHGALDRKTRNEQQ